MLADDGNLDLAGSSQISVENLKELVDSLSECLSNKLTSKAVEIVKRPESAKDVRDASWEIVRIVSDYLTDDNFVKSRDLFECCDEILQEVARIAVPEEALLEFLEQAEALNNDVKFCTMLKPLQIVLNRLKKRKEQSLGFCLNTIKTHLKDLPLPEEQNLEGKEKLLMDVDPCVQRISEIYCRISQFYRPFVDALTLKAGSNIEDTNAQKAREILICFLLHILEKPVLYMDLEWTEDTPKSTPRVSVEEIVMCLQSLMGDLLLILDYSGPPKEPYHGGYSTEEEGDGDLLARRSNLDSVLREDSVPLLSASVLYYLVFAEGLMLDTLPAVYEPIFILRCCLHHSSLLLKHEEIAVLRKGLLLSQKIIKHFPDQRIQAAELDFPVYSNFVEVLTHTMVYCGVEECRKLGVLVFKSFLFKFDTKGRYLLVFHMQKTINHSGTLGYIITLLKDMICEALSEESLSPYFSGKCLHDLLGGYCRLPHGPESDLVELADEIISALNLIRFLLLHDRNNRTGIWDYVRILETNYFSLLREGLKISRAHYELKMRELEAEQKNGGAKGPKRSKVSITVGCQQLPDVPYDQKVFLLHSGLNAFDLMECLLSHVNECMEVKLNN